MLNPTRDITWRPFNIKNVVITINQTNRTGPQGPCHCRLHNSICKVKESGSGLYFYHSTFLSRLGLPDYLRHCCKVKTKIAANILVAIASTCIRGNNRSISVWVTPNNLFKRGGGGGLRCARGTLTSSVPSACERLFATKSSSPRKTCDLRLIQIDSPPIP